MLIFDNIIHNILLKNSTVSHKQQHFIVMNPQTKSLKQREAQSEQEQVNQQRNLHLRILMTLFPQQYISGQTCDSVLDKLLLQKFKNQKAIWQSLAKIPQYINQVRNQLKQLTSKKQEENDKSNSQKSQKIFVGQGTKISPLAVIEGPCIIGKNCEIRTGAYIRPNVIIGDNSLIGNSCQIKNSMVLSNSQIAHFNYIGDSILGFKSHFSAGAITSNYKLDGSNITLQIQKQKIKTEMTKIGAIVGNNVEVGCNAVLNPGSIIGHHSVIYPLVNFRGFLEENRILKLIQTTDIVSRL